MPSHRHTLLCFVVAALTTSGLGACADADKPPAAQTPAALVSRLVPRQRGGALTMTPAPTSYRVEYDLYVKGHTKGGSLDATRVVRNIVRPFDETGTVERSLAFVRDPNSKEARVSFVRPLPDDPRPQTYPPATKPRFRRTIAGRLCAAYVVAGGEYCVDQQGIVLLTRTKNSVEIVTRVTVATETKSADELARALAKGFSDRDLGSIRPLDPDTAPAGAVDYSLDAAPEGFSLVGRYAAVPLTSELLRKGSQRVVAAIVDVYVRGGDAVVVERGGKLDATAVGDEDLGTLGDAHDVDLGPLGAGRVGIGGNGPFGYREVRATPSEGRYVVVAGTVDEDTLVDLARSLKAWPGNGLRYLDEG